MAYPTFLGLALEATDWNIDDKIALEMDFITDGIYSFTEFHNISNMIFKK